MPGDAPDCNNSLPCARRNACNPVRGIPAAFCAGHSPYSFTFPSEYGFPFRFVNRTTPTPRAPHTALNAAKVDDETCRNYGPALIGRDQSVPRNPSKVGLRRTRTNHGRFYEPDLIVIFSTSHSEQDPR